MKNRVRSSFLLVALFALLLTGCVKGNVDIVLNKDGSADLAYKLGVADTASAFLGESGSLEKMKEQSEKAGFKTDLTNEQNYTGITGSKHLRNIDELTKELSRLQGASIETTSSQLTATSSWFYDSYTLNTHIDLSGTNLVNKIPLTLNPSYKDLISGLLAKNMDLKLNVTLPVQASMSNANRVVHNKAFTYQWDLLPGENNLISLQVKVLNVLHVILLVSASVVLAIVVSILVKINGRRGK